MPESISVERDVLPIPDRAYDGPVYEDAKDPAAKFPPIEPLRPPAGAPNVLVVLLDDAGFGCSSAFGGPCNTPMAERLAGRGAEVHALPHHRAVLADPRGAALGPQSPLGWDGRDHGDRDVGAGLQLDAPEHVRAAGGDAQAQRLRDGAVRQVPRGAGVGDEPARPVRQLAERRGRVRVLLRLHRRRDQPVLPGAVRGDDAGRARQDAGGGLPLHRGHDRQGDQVDPPAEGADGRQAVLRLLRARGDARAAPRRAGVVGEVQGQVRPGLGRPARGDVRPPEAARRDPAGSRADRAARGDPGLGRHPRRPQARAGAPDGGLRRLPGAHRPSHRAADRRARRPRRARRHARLLHHRRQRRQRRGQPERLLQRADRPQRRRRAGDDRVHGRADRQVRHARGLQPLRGRLGARDGHAVSVDQAGRVALGRHAQRHDRPLAQRHPGERRAAPPVPPRDRRRARPSSRPPGCPSPQTVHGVAQRADRGRKHALRVRRRGRGRAPRDPVLRDVLQPRDLRQGLDRGHPPLDPVGVRAAAPVRRRHLGALRHQHRLEPGARPGGGDARQAGRAQGAVHGRGAQVQRAAARRPPSRALQLRPRRPAHADQGQLPVALRGHGTAERERR